MERKLDPKYSLQIKNLDKVYLNNKNVKVHALKNINLEFKENEFICIVGPSGCGKSTLLRIIAGLETPSKGKVIHRGEEIKKPGKNIGMVFQNYSLLPWKTVSENILLGPDLHGVNKEIKSEIVSKYLKMIDMIDFADSYPHELSGGMKQRVAIARSLANNPDILLMDEPFGALDAYTRIIMQEELLKIWNEDKKTVLFVTHSVSEAIYLADKIIVMSRRPGEIKEILDVNIPRPRNIDNPEYAELTNLILNMLKSESKLGI